MDIFRSYMRRTILLYKCQCSKIMHCTWGTWGAGDGTNMLGVCWTWCVGTDGYGAAEPYPLAYDESYDCW